MSNTIQEIFSFILSIIASVVQIIVYPINQLVIALFPNFSIELIEISTNINTIFSSITWALGVVPIPIIITLLFIISVEIARHSIYISTHLIIKIWEIIQRVKFW